MPQIVYELISLAQAHPLTAMAVAVVTIGYVNFMSSGPRYD